MDCAAVDQGDAGRAPHAIRLVGGRPNRPRQSREFGARPKHSVKKGKTPVLAADEARALLDAIDISTLVGLRDRALIELMVYTLTRVGAVIKMRVQDVYT